MPMVKKNRGFTLLELLIALAVFGLMSVMAYGGLSAVIETRETVTAAMERLTAIQKTIYRLQTDIEATKARPIRDEYGDVQPAMVLDLDGRGLTFTRSGWRNPLSVPRSAMQRVQYRVEDKKLLRRNWAMLDGYEADKYTEVELLTGVEDLEWRFLGESPEAGQDFEDLDWLEQWPVTTGVEEDPSALPRAVELLLTTKDWGEIRYTYRLNPGMQMKAIANPGAEGGTGGDDSDVTEDEDEAESPSDDDSDSDASDDSSESGGQRGGSDDSSDTEEELSSQ